MKSLSSLSWSTLAVFPLVALLAGCPEDAKKDDGTQKSATPKSTSSASPKPTAATTATAAVSASGAPTATASATAAPASAAESFFAGELPADVKLKPIKAAAMDDGVLLFQPVDGWSGGKLPGNDYMGMSKDQSAVFRLYTSTAVTGGMGCKQLETALGMAPAKIKEVTEVKAPVLAKVGKAGFAAMEGECAGVGPKGPAEVHFINIARETQGSVWHYAVIVSFSKDAPDAVKNEARVYARSLEFTGRNGYKMP